MLNAKLAIGVARRIGCCIFLLWEDIVEVNNKMILTFVGTLIFVGQGGNKRMEGVKPVVPANTESERPRLVRRQSSAMRFERQPNQ